MEKLDCQLLKLIIYLGVNMTLRIGIVGAGENTKLQHIPGFKSIEDVQYLNGKSTSMG